MHNLVAEFNFERHFSRTDPLTTLGKSENGDERREALLALNEPRANGGSEQEQELAIKALSYSALHDNQVICRLAAVQTLSRFKDPRAAGILKDAYYRANAFTPDQVSVLRCKILVALGETRDPAAVELLVKVLREPPVEGPDVDKQQKTDERIAAARALGHFSHYQAATALVEVLRQEKQEVALVHEAHQSLVQATGRNLPPDPQQWNDLLSNPPGGNPSALTRGAQNDNWFLRLTGWTQSKP
jgi:HEAT repeat protein